MNKKYPAHKITDCHTNVELYQTSKTKFKVVYGKLVYENLSYAEAALEYGSCIMHSLMCTNCIE